MDSNNNYQNTIMDATDLVTYDVVVIGSGITGGIAAKELSEKGLSVLVLEKGESLGYDNCQHSITADNDALDFMEAELDKEYFIQKQNYMFNSSTKHLFNNDLRSSYGRDDQRPFNWIRTNCVGGRSLLWGGGAFRWSDLDFKAPEKDGIGIEWPISYADLAPWYSHVEQFAGVSGSIENLPHFPDGEFLPAMQLSKLELHIKNTLRTEFKNRHLMISRVAALTVSHNGRNTDYDAECPKPLHFTEAHFNSLSASLPAALQTNKVKVRSNILVEKLIYDRHQHRVVGVRAVNLTTSHREYFKCRCVFLCASTIASTQILLQSTCESFPAGLANSSGVLGHYLMDHFSVLCAMGIFKDNKRSAPSQQYVQRPTTTCIPRFKNLDQQESNFYRGYGYIGWEGPIENAIAQGGFGDFNDELFRHHGNHLTYTLMGFGECLPYYDNTVSLDWVNTDPYGIPRVKIEFNFKENERRMAEDMVVEAENILHASGSASVYTNPALSIGGDCIHEMGTARMGKDRQTSVLNGNNQAHDVPNVFVTDGACMASSSNIHPTLTYMALTARACDFVVRNFAELKAN